MEAIVAPVDMTLDAVLIADVNVLEVELPGEATGWAFAMRSAVCMAASFLGGAGLAKG